MRKIDNDLELLNCLEDIKAIVNSPSTDLTWSKYDNVEELIKDLDYFINGIRSNEKYFLDDLKLLFAPTGQLHEISLSSGWGVRFLEISKKFDSLFNNYL